MSLPIRAAVSLDGSVPASLADSLVAADRVIEALVEGDPADVARELALDICAWWRDGGALGTTHGPTAVAQELIALMHAKPPQRLSARATGEGSVLVLALVDERVAWSLELRAALGHFVGCIVRGGAPARTH